MYNTNMTGESLSILLDRLRKGLIRLLGKQLVAVYLYGSQARGDATMDSDVDVLVVVKGDFDYFEMVERTGEITAKLSLDYETVISLAFISEEAFEQPKTPFLLNVKAEGVLV